MNKPVLKEKSAIEYAEYLEGKLKLFQESPLVETYLAIKNQIDFWNMQLTGREIDLFADKDSKEFDRSWKYMLEATDVLKKMDEIRKMMSPDQKASADKPKFREGSSAERHIFKEDKK